MHFSRSTSINGAWKRVCGTIYVALYAATLHDIMFGGTGAFSSIPMKLFVGAMFTCIIRSIVQVSPFSTLMRADADTRLGYLCLSDLQSMGENLDTSVVLRRFSVFLWDQFRVVFPSDAPQFGRDHTGGRG